MGNKIGLIVTMMSITLMMLLWNLNGEIAKKSIQEAIVAGSYLIGTAIVLTGVSFKD